MTFNLTFIHVRDYTGRGAAEEGAIINTVF